MSEPQPLAHPISVEDLTVTYDRHPAIHHLSGRFRPGSLTAVVGPNGAGKSTLLKTLVGFLSPAEGRVDLGGLTRDAIAYLPQQAEIERDFPISVIDTVLLGHWQRLSWGRRARSAEIEEALRAIAAVGLSGFELRLIGTLSVGQFQRVLFARMMVQDAPLILLDEPFNALDSKTTADLMDLVARWHGERRTVVAVLHDLDQVRRGFPDTLLVARSCIGWGPTAEVLTAANLLRARAMSEAWDESGAECHGATGGRAQ